MQSRLINSAILSVLLFSSVAFCQCDPNWKRGDGLPGIDGPVYALTTWDPDGNGPREELLIAGGYFTIAGKVVANNIAAWDGNSWQPMGSGINASVKALTVYNSELIAGGGFTAAGGVAAKRIARWNGTTWQSLGSGMNSYVYALTVYNGELIAGGYFTTAGGVATNCIARWNGTTWQPLGSGINSFVKALTGFKEGSVFCCRCWGRNDDGQCDVPSPNSNFIAIAVGVNHSIGLKDDGSVVCWGEIVRGQCDVPSPNSNFTAVAAGAYHSIGLKDDGSVVCWGSNIQGKCDVPSPNGNFTAVAAGDGYHSIGLKYDGSVVCWGWNTFGQCDVPSPNSNFTAIAAGGTHSIGLKDDGSVVCWGRNDEGQCDVPSPNSNFTAVAAGGTHSIGLKDDGSIVCWGRNTYGRCDVPSHNGNFTAIAAGGTHSIGLKNDGSVVCWGRNDESQCDVPSPNSNFTAVAAGAHHSVALMEESLESRTLAGIGPGQSAISTREWGQDDENTRQHKHRSLKIVENNNVGTNTKPQKLHSRFTPSTQPPIPPEPGDWKLYSTVGTSRNANMPNTLMTVNPQAGEQIQRGSQGATPAQYALDVDPISGYIFGVMYTKPGIITRIDPYTGEWSEVAKLQQNIRALAFSPTGTLYGITGHGTLGTINLATSTFSPILTLDIPGFVVGIDFSPQGSLYLVDKSDRPLSQQWVRVVDIANGTIISTKAIGKYSVGDIDFAPDGYIYHTNFSCSLMKIDPSTGTQTPIGFGSLGSLGGIASRGGPLLDPEEMKWAEDTLKDRYYLNATAEIDQSSLVESGWGSTAMSWDQSQTFKPGMPILTGVDIDMQLLNPHLGDTSITVEILQSDIVLATATQLVPVTFTGLLHFDFPSGVAVNVGETYVLHQPGTKDTFGWKYAKDTYPNGIKFLGGEARPNYDWLFQTYGISKPVIEVTVDIKPGSCPNQLNIKSNDVLPVAILGTEDFDVNDIDVSTIMLEGVAPIRSSFEEVAAPVAGGNEYECTTEGPDGFMDLKLQFEIQDIVATLGEVDHGDELTLTLEGALYDETPIQGSDCIVIRDKNKPLDEADINKDGVVNLVDSSIISNNWLKSSVED